MSPAVRKYGQKIAAVVLLLLAGGSQAVQTLTLRLGEVLGPGGIKASNVLLEVDISGAKPSAVLRIEQLAFAAQAEPVRDIVLRCTGMTLTTHRMICPGGQLRVKSPYLAAQDMPVAFNYSSVHERLSLQLPRLVSSYNSADGALASDGLTLALELNLERREQNWRIKGRLSATAGQAYVDPVFADFSKIPLQITFAGSADAESSRIAFSDISLEQPGVLAASGRLLWENNALAAASLVITEAQLPGAFNTYAQPFLIGTALDTLKTEGILSASIARDAAGWAQIRISGEALDIDDGKGRLSINGGALDVDWQRDIARTEASVSRLSWQDATVYKIELGATQLNWQMAGDNLALTQPVAMPVFDGKLKIERAQASNLTSANPEVEFDARLTPLKLAKLSRALGWPEFSGTISGALPRMTYRNSELVLAGGLQAQAFGGDITIEKLTLANPLGARPRLRADAFARNLDLEEMSSAFSFGRITGRLDADVTGLRMLAWQPVEFKAWLRTPEGDRSRRRISQGAIDDIASLGGGGAGLVSRGFLGLFDDFAYDRIGLGCYLKQGVCAMRGLGPAEDGGYVIVRGNWLPRINVIGYNRLVSWPVLLEQLKSITAGSGPVVNPDNPPVR